MSFFNHTQYPDINLYKIGLSIVGIIKGNMLEFGPVDVIVNAANELLKKGGGIDNAIHKAAGTQLQEACNKIPIVSGNTRCQTGSVRLTPSFNIQNTTGAKYIIHAVGPRYNSANSKEILKQTYESIFANIDKNPEYFNVISIPAISGGIFGFPAKESGSVALTATREYLKKKITNGSNKKRKLIILFFLMREDNYGTDIYNTWLTEANNSILQAYKLS
jgi:O-acetyl-ADP-ribose deacetylase (regulator of RNase III)